MPTKIIEKKSEKNPAKINGYGLTAETFIDHIENFFPDESFPVDVFPLPFLNLILETEKSLNFPVDYVGTAILSAVATAIGKSAKIRVKKGWYEFPATYVALVGKPGANKSHPIEAAFKPFAEIDKKEIGKFGKEYEKYEEFLSLNKKEKEGLRAAEKPILKKTLLHNFTPEILHQRLAENDRGCTIISEELATFLDLMNNYSKGDQASVYLSFWSNKATSIDRMSKAVPLLLPQPFLNIIGSVQPRILPKIFPSNKTDNGFLQRFLFAFPDNAEKQPINDLEIDESVLEKYKKWIIYFRLCNPVTTDNETGLPTP